MTLKAQELSILLALPNPWKIHKINEDQLHKHLTVELTCEVKKHNFFSSIKDVTCPNCKQVTTWPTTIKYLTIRHVNLGNYKIYLHIPDLELNCSHGHADCPMILYSNPNLLYSHPLEQKIREFWDVPNGANIAAKLLQLQPNELEKLIEYNWLPQMGTIPPLAHPVWQAIITHRIPLNTKNLGLQCLLTWANGQLQRGNLNEHDRLTKIGMVRSYFEKYRNTLQSELEQLLNAQGIS